MEKKVEDIPLQPSPGEQKPAKESESDSSDSDDSSDDEPLSVRKEKILTELTKVAVVSPKKAPSVQETSPNKRPLEILSETDANKSPVKKQKVEEEPVAEKKSTILYGSLIEDDSSVSEEAEEGDDPTFDYWVPVCICRQNSYGQMIACDTCSEWFHYNCMGLSEQIPIKVTSFHCPLCRQKNPKLPLTVVREKKEKPTNVSDINQHDYDFAKDAKSHALPENIEQYLKSRKIFSGKKAGVFKEFQNGEQLEKYVKTVAFDMPLKALSKRGLGIVLPKELPTKKEALNFINEKVGGDHEVDIIDVATQKLLNPKWNVQQWTEYFSKDEKDRDRICNVLSLEFSDTQLGKLVKSPRVVRNDLDWRYNVWPSTRSYEAPLVSKYCLMSCSNSFTDFHVDFGGSSVWYHVFQGKKVFYFMPPTYDNLREYEKFVNNSNNLEKFEFFGEDKCYKVTLKAGQTMLIPGGWIHAVWTPVDSIVFGGNFLCFKCLEKQVDIYEIETRALTPIKYCYPKYEEMLWYSCVKLKNVLSKRKKALSKEEESGFRKMYSRLSRSILIDSPQPPYDIADPQNLLQTIKNHVDSKSETKKTIDQYEKSTIELHYPQTKS